MSSTHYTSQRNLYLASSNWGGDDLDPSAIAASVLNMVDRTRRLVPAGQQWFIIDRKRVRYSPLTESLPEIIEANEIPGDFGEPDPGWGYSVLLFTLASEEGPPSGTSLTISLTAGSACLNRIRFEIGDSSHPPDYGHLSYQTYRDMIGAIAEVFPCPWIFARNSRSPRVHPPADVAVNGPLDPTFGGAWIAYLSAPLAKGLRPPEELAAEPTRGGGLFLSATQTLLDQSNPEEMRRSRLLDAICRERIGLGPGGGFPQSTPVRVGPA